MGRFDLTDKTIVISGAAAGIGAQTAASCADMGARLVLLDRDAEGLDRTLGGLAGGGHQRFCVDLTDYPSIEKAIKEAVAAGGKVAGLVHSAGIGMNMPLKVLKPDHVQQVLAVNTVAAIELARVVTKRKFLAPEGASLVFISSVMGLVGDISNIAYCASKGALLPAAKAMALELSPKKVRVNCVLPGVVRTEMAERLFATISEEALAALEGKHPLGFGRPEDVANACVYLLSDAARWVTGVAMNVDGGYCAH